jgi:uncharacterized protein
LADAVVVNAQQSPERRFESIASPLHTVVLLVLLAAIAVLGYLSIHQPSGVQYPSHLEFYLPTLIWEWAAFGYIYWGVRRRGKTFADVAGPRWKNPTQIVLDVVLALGTWIVSLIVLIIVSFLLRLSGSVSVDVARHLAPHGPVEDTLWVMVAITAGICEETIFRGYLQRQFIAWFQNVPVGVVLSAILFGAAHIYQGVRLGIVIAVYGLVFGILAQARGNIRPGMIMHAWQDTFSGFAVRLLPK